MNPETAAIRVKLIHLVWAAVVMGGALISWTAWSVDKLNSIESRLAALQDAQPKYWTIADEERRGNWLIHDNPHLTFRLRDVRDVISSRNP